MGVFTFLPFTRDQYDKFCYFEGAFSKEECEKVLSLWDKTKEQEAYTGSNPNAPDKAVRDSRLFWLTHEEKTDWLYKKLTEIIIPCNEARYKFDLSGFMESLQLTRYDEMGHYKWHEDNGAKNFSIRKLSIVVQLTPPEEYEGGDTEIFDMGKLPKTQGTVSIFPSYVTHRVTPVLKGTRHSLVAWVSGPPFR
jgi:PKHD-type hydroxylase